MASELFEHLYARAVVKDCALVTTLENYLEQEEHRLTHVVDLVRLAARMIELYDDFRLSMQRFPVLDRLAFTHRCPRCGKENCGTKYPVKLADYDQYGRPIIWEVET